MSHRLQQPLTFPPATCLWADALPTRLQSCVPYDCIHGRRLNEARIFLNTSSQLRRLAKFRIVTVLHGTLYWPKPLPLSFRQHKPCTEGCASANPLPKAFSAGANPLQKDSAGTSPLPKPHAKQLPPAQTPH